jgi:mono/diheme cytochrome c family protein
VNASSRTITVRSRFLLPLLAAIGLIACAVLAATAPRAQDPPHSIWDGVYTAAQAQRGAAQYTSQCLNCHMDSLAGNGADIPPLAGKMFLMNWDGLGLDALFDRIHTTMPQSDPGSLSPQQVVDLMAYLLSANSIPAGAQELTTDTTRLQGIQFDAKRPHP